MCAECVLERLVVAFNAGLELDLCLRRLQLAWLARACPQLARLLNFRRPQQLPVLSALAPGLLDSRSVRARARQIVDKLEGELFVDGIRMFLVVISVREAFLHGCASDG